MAFEEWWYRKEIERGDEGINTSINTIKNLARQSWEAAQPQWQAISEAPSGEWILGMVGSHGWIFPIIFTGGVWGYERYVEVEGIGLCSVVGELPKGTNLTHWMPLHELNRGE